MQKREDKEGSRIEKRICESVSSNHFALYESSRPQLWIANAHCIQLLTLDSTVRRLVGSDERQGRPQGTGLFQGGGVAAE